ncbi:MAG: YceI family protein [Actinobacteria bacterium]|nr:YceI family protein [Actinomycetota bacterium]
MSEESAIRPVQGIPAPGPGTWRFDPAHTAIGFTARHLMVTRVRGRFARFDGAIEVAERPEDSRVEIRIEAASIETGAEQRDTHLRSPDFLDVERFPALEFRSSGLELAGGSRFLIHGDLTIRDVTRPVTLEAEYLGQVPDMAGGTKVAFVASTEIEREDWGLTWNVVFDTGALLVSKKVQIELEVQAVAATTEVAA